MSGKKRATWLALGIAALGLPMSGQAAYVAEPVFQLDFSNPGLSPSHWTLAIHPDGSGHFQTGPGNAAPGGTPGSTQESSPGKDAPNVDRDIQLSAEFAERVLQTAHQHQLSKSQCENHTKVAFQGWKKLKLSGPDGEWSCEYNYSNDKEIQALGDSLVAVAETIMEGAQLESLLQHDRLGLDSKMEYMMEAAEEGRLQQVCAIRGILERLADDPAVLERVKKRAKVLLAKAEREDQGAGTGVK
jgi:hypothetical protein